MRVGQVNLADQTKRMGSPAHDYLDWRARPTSFVDLAGWYGSSINLDGYTEEMQPRLRLMMGAVLGVLLIACLNVSNLLLAGSLQRVHEVAVRTALGASRRRVLFQFLVESSLIATLGCLLGLGLSLAGIKLFLYFMGGALPSFWMEVRLDPAVLLFTAAMTALAAFLSGILPAVQAARMEPLKLLKDQARGSSPLKVGALSNSLVIGEIALSCSPSRVTS